MAGGGPSSGSGRPPGPDVRRSRATTPLLSLFSILVLAVGGAACGGDDTGPVPGTTTIVAGGVGFNAVVRRPAGNDASLTVLFLHGASYTSRIWADREVLDRVADAGLRAVAVDLPGSGGTRPTDRSPADVLAGLVEHLGPPGHVVVVSPSASGRYSLAMLAERADVHPAGFVAVAPVGIEGFRPADRPPLPALLLWGEDDDVVPLELAEALRARLPGSELVVVPDGSHAPYDDEPEAFTDELLRFVDGLDRP